MGFWPDWWPANPIGSAWDSAAKWFNDWQWVIYLIIIAIVAIIVLALFLRLRGR
jgi:hypothetical protein